MRKRLKRILMVVMNDSACRSGRTGSASWAETFGNGEYLPPRRRRDQMVHRLMSRPNLVNPDDLKGLQDNLL